MLSRVSSSVASARVAIRSSLALAPVSAVVGASSARLARRTLHSAAMSQLASATPVAATVASSAPVVGTPAAVSPLLNPGLPRFSDPAAMLSHMLSLTREHDLIRNYVGVVENMSAAVLVVETDLFPRDALEFYSKYNLLQLDLEHNARDKDLHARFYTPARGGGQGDYRVGIREKMANVVSALRGFPNSKRAVLTVPFTNHGSINADHTDTDEAKCLRELTFYLDGPAAGPRRLSCTGVMRAQAASIFPKNIHFIGSIMQHVADQLQVQVGTYTHHVTTLVDVRLAGPPPEEAGFFKPFLAGAIACTIAAVATYPVGLVKTHHSGVGRGQQPSHRRRG